MKMKCQGNLNKNRTKKIDTKNERYTNRSCIILGEKFYLILRIVRLQFQEQQREENLSAGWYPFTIFIFTTRESGNKVIKTPQSTPHKRTNISERRTHNCVNRI